MIFEFQITNNQMVSIDDCNKFEKACKVGDLGTVKELFDKVKKYVVMLEVRNLVTRKGNLNVLEYFYQQGVDIQGFYNLTNPMEISARRGWVDIVNFLLEIGLDINLQNYDGWTPLMAAAVNGTVDIVDKLLETGQCNVNHKDRWGDTALFLVVKRGHLGVVDKLLAYGANYYHINNDGENLLHYAVRGGNINILQRVISLGLDVNHQNNKGQTPLMIAARYEKEIVKILLKHGADPKIKSNLGYMASGFTIDPEIKILLNTTKG